MSIDINRICIVYGMSKKTLFSFGFTSNSKHSESANSRKSVI